MRGSGISALPRYFEGAAVVAVVMVPCGTMAPSNLGGCMGIIRREDVRAACLCCCWPERASSVFENVDSQRHSQECNGALL